GADSWRVTAAGACAAQPRAQNRTRLSDTPVTRISSRGRGDGHLPYRRRRTDLVTLDHSGRLPLHYAAHDDDVLEATRLLAAGANPNRADNEGLTPLHFAASMQAERTATVLLEHGASVSTTD